VRTCRGCTGTKPRSWPGWPGRNCAAHAVLRFRADGRWEGRQNGRRVSGRWRVERDELCLLAQGPGAWEECHEVQARGGRVRLLQDGYVVLEGRLKR
jgi:hypothetical protein